MGQRESPQSEIGGGVRDTAQGEFDCVDGLVDEHIAEVELKARGRGEGNDGLVVGERSGGGKC